MTETTENNCEVIAGLRIEVWTSGEPLSFGDRFRGAYRRLSVGDSWGGLFDCGWFRFTGTVPAGECAEELSLRLDVNGELLVVDADGNPVRGLTNLSSVFDRSLGTPEKIFVALSELGIAGGEFEVWAEAGCNDLFGALQQEGRIRFAELVRRPAALVKGYFDGRFEQEAEEASVVDDGFPLYAVGHSHLDLGWLWPIRETRRKGVRTFATALANMKRYGWYCFGASQPQLYQWVGERCPALLEEVIRREREGRWELQGGMWVECDTHLPDGESLMRQFIYGQEFWRKVFGHQVSTVWLPDVFGYSGSLPQIAKLNGADCILTMKNAWNRFNPFPYNGMNWTGIDGTSILAYRLPEGTYNGSANAGSIAKCQKEDAQRQAVGASLMLYGIGDGGAGPGETHLELLQRMTGRADFPELRHAPSTDFFRLMREHADRLPGYQGELYLENHQGTFTTCEQIKRLNRNYEITRQTMEFAAVRWGRALPEWFGTWEREMLLYQFHDILPGTSIRRVYDEAAQSHEAWQRKIDGWFGPREDDRFFNPASALVSRFRKTGNRWERLRLEPLTEGSYEAWQGEAVRLENQTLSNGRISVSFDAQGRMVSWKALLSGTELLKEPAHFQLYEDKGNAWNIEPETYGRPLEKGLRLQEQSFRADGPLGICRQRYAFGRSRMTVEFTLAAEADACEMMVSIDWHEAEVLLRYEVPTVLNPSRAQYGTQFGFKEFSTKNDSSVERAQYEISAQRWVRLEEEGCGLALASDCKYGYSLKNGIMNATLLRCAERPGAFIGKDDNARSGNAQFNDQGIHEFALALICDRGNLNLAEDIAAWLNRPVPQVPAWKSSPAVELPWQNGQFGLSCLRPALRENGFLMRVFERRGREGRWSSPPGWKAVPVSPDERTVLNDGCMSFHPFEIKTFLMIESA